MNGLDMGRRELGLMCPLQGGQLGASNCSSFWGSC